MLLLAPSIQKTFPLFINSYTVSTPLPMIMNQEFFMLKTKKFQPTGDTGNGWYLSNDVVDGNYLEIIANDTPIATVALDLYEQDNFDDIEQAKANAQLLVNAHKLLQVARQCEEALTIGDSLERTAALKELQKVLQDCGEYSGPDVSRFIDKQSTNLYS